MPPPTRADPLRTGVRALRRKIFLSFIRLLGSEPEWERAVHVWGGLGGQQPLEDPRVQVGRHSYGVDQRSVFLASESDRLTIGNFCSIASGVRFIFGNHAVDTVTTFPLRTMLLGSRLHNVDAVSRGPITVGHDVWIASDSLVLSGVTIGDGAVIGAGSVVTRDVPPYSLSAGIPARHIRHRFPEEQIARLRQTRWWDWPDEKILANLEDLYGSADAFVAKHGGG